MDDLLESKKPELLIITFLLEQLKDESTPKPDFALYQSTLIKYFESKFKQG
jgi:hypothetical protein